LKKIAALWNTLASRISKLVRGVDADPAERPARALLIKAASASPEQSESAIAVCDEVITEFGAATDEDICVDVADALFLKRWILERLGRNDAVIATCDQTIARFSSATGVLLRNRVAKAILDK
jgi:hypothetical protein